MIEPFRVAIQQHELDELRDRIRNARWPEPETNPSQGVPLAELRELSAYWAEGYDWRAVEARLNGFPQFRTEIDGLGIHFLHLRSPNPDATPLVLTHGWPGSVLEFLGVLVPLADEFHLVVASLPGYGFSDKPAEAGWGIDRIARAWAELMSRLGYERFGAQGHDWGTSVTARLGQVVPARMIGIHVMPPLAGPAPDDELTDAERAALARMRDTSGDGYSLEHSTRPQTIGTALGDTPIGLAAWMVEKFIAWSDEPLGRDAMLDEVTLYWLTGTAASSARLYWESIHEVREIFAGRADTIEVPTGCTVYPHENPRPSRRWAERRFTDIRYWSEPRVGGHFAALEQPESFVAEVRAAFRAMR